MSDLLTKFTNFLEEHQLIQKNDYVLVAVSGGVDSVVLLHLLLKLAETYRLKNQILHLNHNLRGKQSDSDQQFVEQLAEKYGLPIISRKVDVPKFIVKKGLSEEQGARILRYRFFNWALKKTGADCIALGHQADDQVETVIDHFFRGSGVRGLSGMPVRRDKFIRPLLFAGRHEIETYAKTHSLQYIIDSTNVMVKYRRNRIRYELIPYLKQHFNPAIPDVVLRSARIMDEAERYLKNQAELALESCLINCKKNKIVLDINAFLNYFIIIQKYILYLLLDRLHLSRSILTTEKLDFILKLVQKPISGKKAILTSNWQLWIDHDQLVILEQPNSEFEIEIAINNTYPLLTDDLYFIAELVPRNQLPERFSEDSDIEYVDYDSITGRLVIRNFRPGDRFRPLNFKGEKKLSDFFTDCKVPLHQRREIPLLVCDSGIIWIIGYQIDDRFKITGDTEHVLRLTVSETSSQIID